MITIPSPEKSPKYEFRQEPFTKAWVEEAKPLFLKHYDEIKLFSEIQPEINFDHYVAASVAGILRLYTVREDGELVGYCAFVVGPHPHYMKSVQAVEDIIYLRPESRKGRMGIDFMKWADKELEKEGVELIYRHSGVKRDTGKLMEVMGYDKAEEIYVRKVG